MRRKIQTRSKAELNSFLTNLRKSTSKIGELAMLQAAKNSGIDESIIQKKKKRPAPSAPNPFTNEVEDQSQIEDISDEYKMSPQESIDYSPIYRCLHIYQVLVNECTVHKIYRVIITIYFTENPIQFRQILSRPKRTAVEISIKSPSSFSTFYPIVKYVS